MRVPETVAQLRAHRATFESLFAGTPPALRTWKPDPKHWCLLEIVCHLYDEEREDFRARVRSVLEDPSRDFPQIDPPAWPASRRYLEQDFDHKLAAFLDEREASVGWLEGLADAPWENAFEHPKVGPVTARLLLVNWLAHDLLHIRQIVRVKYRYLERESGVRIDYAGKW